MSFFDNPKTPPGFFNRDHKKEAEEFIKLVYPVLTYDQQLKAIDLLRRVYSDLTEYEDLLGLVGRNLLREIEKFIGENHPTAGS